MTTSGVPVSAFGPSARTLDGFAAFEGRSGS